MQRRLWLAVAAVLVPAAGVVGADEPAPQHRRTPVVAVFEQCRDAVVNISTTRLVRMRGLGFDLPDIFDFGRPRGVNRRVQSVGSGVVVHERGYIVTNAHVVAQATDVQVTFADGTTRTADPVATDPEHDLAVLRVTTEKPLPRVKLGRSADILVGETVVAIGNPLGLQHTVTTGIVSALGRDLQFSEEVVYRGLIQTDAPINPGNSGGPLLNIDAELIGINSAIRGDAQNIGFAIPVDRLWELLPTLLDIEKRQRVRLGLAVSGADARVVTVRPASPAAEAGLGVGDRIVSFNDEPVRDGIDFYVHLLDQKPDARLTLGVQRGEQRLTLNARLQPVPPPDGRALALRLFGMTLETLPAETRRKYGLPADVGLVVTSVERGGPADRARIRPGDLIIQLGRTRVFDLEDVGNALEQTRAGDDVFVVGLRVEDDSMFQWYVTLPARGGLQRL